MLTLQNKGLTMTQEQRTARELWYEQKITEAALEENHAECKRLRAARRHELRGASKFPPERVDAEEIRIYDARGHKDAPQLLYDPRAAKEPLKIGNQRVVLTESQKDRWR